MQALDFRKTNHNMPETWALFPANTINIAPYPQTPPLHTQEGSEPPPAGMEGQHRALNLLA